MSEKSETFKIAMWQAVKIAEREFSICYVLPRAGYYQISCAYESGWLFRVYPGGRKELSAEGTKLLEREQAIE
jgi:hypothetical protein